MPRTAPSCCGRSTRTCGTGWRRPRPRSVLGVRRQTLYNRLARIQELLGGEPLADYERHTALGVALHAWRLRTGLDPGRRLASEIPG